ncbi:MAG: carboxypeptidase regulatory-like domain-containing protein [Patescibacteria group bacterium]
MRFIAHLFLVLLSFFVLAGIAQAAPNAPTNFSGYYYVASGYGMVSVSWTDNANDEVEFQLFRKLSTDAGWPSSWLTKYGAKSTPAPSTVQSNDPNANLPAGTYDYKVRACDSSSCSDFSNVYSVTVGSSGSGSDTTSPSWPSSYTIGTSILSSTGISVSWSAATDNMSIAGYKIYRNGTQITTTTLISYTDANLSPATTYIYSIIAYDAAGNNSSQITASSATTWNDTSNTTSTSTTPVTDTTIPVITNVRAENIMGPGTQIKWSTDDASNSRVSYGLSANNLFYLADYRCDGTGYITSHCVNLTDLSANAVYYYKVKSLNSAGLDAESAVYQFTSASSAAAMDTTSPTSPTAVSSYAISSSGISLSWSGATDNMGVTGYKIYRNGTYISTSSGLSYADSGLSPSTSYYYNIAAMDGAGNISNMSPSTSATTMANTSATTAITYASISGKVTDWSGAAVSGANIYISSSDRYYSAMTDSSGQYSFVSVQAATYSAKAYAPSGVSYQLVSKGAALTAGQALVLDFQFAASAKTIKGKISYPDSRPVTNVGIGAYNSVSGAWTNGYVNEQGTFVLQVSGGKWQVNIYPKYTAGTASQTNDWSYMEPPREATFRTDESIEEAIIDFTVKGAQVAVRGIVFLPDGSAPSSGIVTVSLKGSSGFEQRPNIDSSGLFFIYLPADTYNGEVFSTDSRYSGVSIAPFSVSNNSIDLGKFYLKAKSEKIKGAVKDANGNAVTGAWVSANQYTTGKFAQTKSAEDGSFEISVSAGEWSVQAYTDPMLGYSYNQPPKFLSVPSGGTVETHFVMTKSDAQISGNIVDANGQVVSDASGYISTYIPSVSMTTMYSASPSFGGQIEKGSFSFKLPAGTYTLNVHFPPDSAHISPSPQPITVAYGEAKKINLAIAKSDVTLSGFLKDDSGNIIKGLGDDKVKVYLSTKGGTWHNLKIDANTGAFSAQISAGTWYLGYWTDPASGYVSSGKDIEIILLAGESKKVDVSLLKANSIISGIVKTSDGILLANVWISVNSRSFSTMSDQSSGATYGSSYVSGASSDTSGKFDIKVPSGKYFLQSSYQMSSGYLNPSEVEVAVEFGKTAAVEIVFKKPDAILSGITTVNGNGAPAYVWAWRDSGGYANARADEFGKYSFAISRGAKWRVAASMEKNGSYYKSADVVIEVGDQAAVTQDLTLLSIANMPIATERVVETVKPQSVELGNGAKVVLPANSLATAGTASIMMKPEVEVPSSGSTSVVGTGYKVEAKNENGQDITNLNSEVTISIPYNDADLAAKGLEPENLTLSFFDETAQIWKPVDKQVVDKDTKTVSGVVSHLTLFALVAPADTTPPSAPTSISAVVANGQIKLSWKNPASDFHHIKIYRSSQKGSLGEVAFNYLTNESQTDISSGKVAHYTVKTVDLAGNESANSGQYAVDPTGNITTPINTEESQTLSISTEAMLIQIEGDPRVYIVANNFKRHIPSPSVFNAYGYKWSDIKKISSAEAAKFATTVLIRAKNDTKVYAVANGKRKWITSAEEFNKNGYKWNAIAEVNASELAAYADGGIGNQITARLSSGMKNEEVRLLQTFLAKDKEIYPQGLVTGMFGKLTRAAVQKFQKKHGIKDVSGIVGDNTKAKINELLKTSE